MQLKMKFCFLIGGLLLGPALFAQNNLSEYDSQYPAINSDTTKAIQPILSIDSTKKGKYTLVFVNRSKGFDENLKQRLISTFFKVYPKQAKLYNKKTRRRVVFSIEPGYNGVAAASRGRIFFNPAWFIKNPEDIDVVTHEAMHIIQSYGGGSGPGWITEGIADYVRYKMGVNNEGSGWKLPEYTAKQNFNNSYRVTARFFVWIEKNHDKNFVKKLDAAMRTKTYTADLTKTHTGKTFEELWAAYAANPAL